MRVLSDTKLVIGSYRRGSLSLQSFENPLSVLNGLYIPNVFTHLLYVQKEYHLCIKSMGVNYKISSNLKWFSSSYRKKVRKIISRNSKSSNYLISLGKEPELECASTNVKKLVESVLQFDTGVKFYKKQSTRSTLERFIVVGAQKDECYGNILVYNTFESLVDMFGAKYTWKLLNEKMYCNGSWYVTNKSRALCYEVDEKMIDETEDIDPKTVKKGECYYFNNDDTIDTTPYEEFVSEFYKVDGLSV